MCVHKTFVFVGSPSPAPPSRAQPPPAQWRKRRRRPAPRSRPNLSPRRAKAARQRRRRRAQSRGSRGTRTIPAIPSQKRLASEPLLDVLAHTLHSAEAARFSTAASNICLCCSICASVDGWLPPDPPPSLLAAVAAAGSSGCGCCTSLCGATVGTFHCVLPVVTSR